MRNFLILLLLISSSMLHSIEKADLIISSNKVILMTGHQKAQPLSIAIQNKKIAWIGSHSEAKKFKDNALTITIKPFFRVLLMLMVTHPT